MKLLLYFILCLFFSTTSYGQQVQKFKTKHSITRRGPRLDLNKFYDGKTGEKLDSATVYKILRSNTENIRIESEYDRYGNVSKNYLYYSKSNYRTTEQMYGERLQAGEKFTAFSFLTKSGKTITNKDLLGKLVVILFSPVPSDDLRYKKEKIEAIAERAKASEKDIALIFIPAMTADESVSKLPAEYNVVVKNYNAFMIKFKVKRFPSAILIDEDGHLIRYENDLTEITF